MIDLSTVRTDLFIGGEWRKARETFTTLNPATGRPLAELAAADAADVDAAVTAATDAFRGDWGALPPSRKAVLLNKLADLVERDVERLAALESADMGRPVGAGIALMIPNLVATLRYYAGWADKINGELITNDGYMGGPTPTHAYLRRDPLGVVAAIVPWNAPLMILGWKLAPALACGNTVIVKPAEDASLSILALADLVTEAGFPPGTVNVLTGIGKVAGEALSLHPGVKKISFTGSTEVGRTILRNSAATFKRTALELGGKAPQIVFDDANLEAAVQGCAMGMLFNQGEVCAAGTRILAHRTVFDAVVAGLKGAAEAQVLGDPFDPATTLGPVVNAKQRDRVVDFMNKGAAEGADVITGGSAATGEGFFVRPTVLVGRNDMTVAREEIFGPVAVVIPFDDDDEAVALANDNQYGLSATLWTGNVSRAHRISARIEAGAVAVNGWSPLAPQLPWGGMKASGIGRELGYEGILSYTEPKTVTVVL
ncbi:MULTISPECIES: aldehyde dehydrogenase family protein [unclassified Rhodococcus (in: high G+C Gram-positive bacteria)]|uniref:aldehyde dehydrogenase family protein n=1 Tax=unclassified Rhodococcus (in: high G+C Gram-positive bacteria) TaxID=192944 RepID=UPI00096AB6A7|nr:MULTISPECIES: aldehyde dehydrogenase family protein [unclassified Rhodococcus (in: high G+C Gram-positive bacteria)]